jgi:hypothetical protein
MAEKHLKNTKKTREKIGRGEGGGGRGGVAPLYKNKNMRKGKNFWRREVSILKLNRAFYPNTIPYSYIPFHSQNL